MNMRQILPTFSVLLVTACGGGGGSSDDTPTPIAVNVFPNATTQSVATDEDVDLDITLAGSDSDGSIVGYAITSRPTNGSLSGTGANLVYTPNLNFNGADSFQFAVLDDDGAPSVPAAINITINPINDAPLITLDDSFDIAENQTTTGILLNLLASDLENDEINVLLEDGIDSDLLSINSTTSELVFNTAPDFENPIDTNADNIYQVSVLFTDGNNGQTSATINVEVTDESTLEVVTTFPTANANLGGVVDEITVTGRLIDSEDNQVLPTDVSALTVNDIQATIADNATWSATVPVIEQTNTLLIEVESISNSVFSDTQQGINTIQPTSLESFTNGVLDNENNRLLILDLNYNGIFALDLSTNAVTNISDSSVGTGQRFESPNNLTLDSTNNVAYVSDDSLNAIFEIDLTTGNRSILSDETTGDGPQIDSPSALFFDNLNNRLYVTDLVNDRLIEIDTSTGNKMTVSNDANDALGDNLERPIQIFVDGVDNIAYILDLSVNSSVVSIDLSTGERSVLVSPSVGTGDIFSNPRGMILSNDRASLYISSLVVDDFVSGEIIEVDLGTLQRQVISDNSTGNGINYEGPNSLVSSNNDNLFFVLDNFVEGVIETNATSGDRSLLTNPENARNFLDASGVVIDSSNDRLLVIDENNLYAVDISSTENAGTITSLSNADTGFGPILRLASTLAFDEENNRVFTTSAISLSTNTLVAIDLATGERSLIPGFSSTDSDNSISDIAYDPTADRIIFLDSAQTNLDGSTGGLASVNLTTGDITALSTTSFTDSSFVLDIQRNRVYGLLSSNLMSLDLSTGTVALLSTNAVDLSLQLFAPLNLTFDSENDRVLIAEAQTNQVLSIDIETGARSILSNANNSIVLRAVRSIALDPSNNRLFLSDVTEDNIFIIDTETGERAYVTH